jgi:hypothetical protein
MKKRMGGAFDFLLTAGLVLVLGALAIVFFRPRGRLAARLAPAAA